MLELTEADGVLVATGELDIYAVGDARPRFEAATKLDLSHISSVDGAGVQLLAWWCAGNPARRVVGGSDAVSVACAALGLGHLAGAP